MPPTPVFLCPKCGTPLTGEVNEKNDTICPNEKCRRRWRMQPDRSALMGVSAVLQVHNVRQTNSAPKIGDRNG